jgi:hypothetical protein
MTVTDKASLTAAPSYASAFDEFLAALDQLESAGAALEAAYHAEPTFREPGRGNPTAASLRGHLASARVGNLSSLGELRRALAPEPQP